MAIFKVNRKFPDLRNKNAVPEQYAKLYPESPIIVDTTHAINHFGFPEEWFDIALKNIISGSEGIFLP